MPLPLLLPAASLAAHILPGTMLQPSIPLAHSSLDPPRTALSIPVWLLCAILPVLCLPFYTFTF